MTRLAPCAFEPRGKRPPPERKPRMRLWSVRHTALLERVYARFEAAVARAAPMLARVGYDRLERPTAALEAAVKGFLFDCRMCGDCVLSNTGMSCPMNCPKAMRNGPCGGVRADGNCEVYPKMHCVWLKAYEGSLAMRGGAAIAEILPPLDHGRKGSSTWLRLARETASA
ncbi:MAG TPA: methylenetetrahydrofolate reductase C-terminal domain-containing protein [Roseiarcus sp.]|nr:methylenetetrahydrofolate reductase C-terminal domain-containing protein [Roseiarcus sp.]